MCVCLQAFQQFDSEGDGTADVSTMMEALRASNSASSSHMKGELGAVVRTLQACSLTPGQGTLWRRGVGELRW